MARTVSTDGLAPGARVELWRHAMSQAFVPLSVASADPQRFSWTLATHQIGELMVAGLRSGPQRIDRTPRLIAASDRQLWQIALAHRGRVRLEQDGRQTELGPGDLVVYETARPFQWSFDQAWEATLFTLPRAAVALTPGESALITARRLPGQTGMGGVVSRFLRDLAAHAADLSGPQSRRVTADLTDLVLTLIVDSLGTATARSGTQRALLIQIKAYIGAHVSDPNLTPTRLAEEHHISTRYLHTLFEGEPRTVAAHIRALRLARAARNLLDPRWAHSPIAAVAAGVGFGDLSGFERAFKAAYGVTPREHRALHGPASDRQGPDGAGCARTSGNGARSSEPKPDR